MNKNDAVPDFNGTVVLPSGVKLKMIKVEPGSFIMSADDGENEKGETPHPVTLKYDFFLGKTMVTQMQFRMVMGYHPESNASGGNLPVKASWYEAMDFCDRLNELNLAPEGYRFTLPTETQWEYAARGGCKSQHFKYSGSDNLDEVAWANCSRRDMIYPVAKKKPNELGLYDMSGNEWEWCLDDHVHAEDSSKLIPEFSRGSERTYVSRACRGGSSVSYGIYCRPGRRNDNNPFKSGESGNAFRIALASTSLPEHPQYAKERLFAEECRRNYTAGDFVVELPGNVKLGMVKVEPGTFEMGEDTEDTAKKRRKKTFSVTLTHDFYIGKTTVTQEQWRTVMKDKPSLRGVRGETKWDELPMHGVNWYMAMAFCARLNELELAPAGYTFTLPTEAQWEYAARGGCKSQHFKYSGSDNENEVAWVSGSVRPVARKKANELGLYDMSGNIEEWCLDDYKEKISKVIPEFSRDSEKSSSPRVCRGGSVHWNTEIGSRRIVSRTGLDAHLPTEVGDCEPTGFRIVLAAPVKPLASDDLVLKISARDNLEMVKVIAGSFTMGAQRRGGANFSDETPHQVTLTKDFYIGRIPVTQAQWKSIMGSNPSHCSYENRDYYPVDNVTWFDAMEFCAKLNERGKAPAGYKFTLPTEAQWEYAARGGSESQGYRYSGSNNFKEVAQCHETLAHWRDSCPVAQKQPNELGLYDMSGNVEEWCLDWYDKDYGCGNADVTDPAGPADCPYPANTRLKDESGLQCPERVLRGGSFSHSAALCRSIYRGKSSPDHTYSGIGFRLALVVELQESKKTGEQRKTDVAESSKLTEDHTKCIKISEDGTVLIKYSAQRWDESCTVPEGITEIGDNAFAFCENLVRITIPEGVTKIGRSAFESCKKLTAVDIPGSVASIGSHAFIGCYRLSSVRIPEGVTRIESSTFLGCSSLSSVDIPGSVTSIGANAFQGCANLVAVHIPDSVTSIEESAFRKCNRLAEVSIPAGVTSIGECLFRSCEKLIRVNLPAGITSIGDCAFDSCKALCRVNIPDGVTSIGENAFRGCSNLVELHIPDSVTQIGKWAFTRCGRLVRVNIPAGVTCIASGAFDGCGNLVDMYIPDNVTSIEDCAFSGCSSLASIRIPDTVTSIGCCAFSGCSSLASIHIPDSVTRIAAGAFEKCSSLAPVRIPDGVRVGTDAFKGCKRVL